MKRPVIFLIIFSFCTGILFSQKVDSIRVEQSGDFIKVRYKILDSRPDQVFRIRVLCSINGGLNTELKSISGDTGEQVLGGKPEYWVVWDVLKDVDEIKTVDFIIRAELIRDLSSAKPSDIKPETDFWIKKRYNVMASLTGPGPKAGLRVGYMGNFGVSVQLSNGKIEKGYAEYDPGKGLALSVDLTKRIFKTKSFYTHLLVGYHETDLLFINPEILTGSERFSVAGVSGVEAGVLAQIKRVTFLMMFTHLDPGRVEKKDNSNLELVSPANYLTFGAGLRF